ncbi:nitrogen fixation protein FixH [Chryseobacterium sp. Leaf404]|uniref:FixH family protein n=1 Tax=unclassified Chryseobacterium TaxID=2593645 RepID=UPI0006F9DEAE|nr:MULTISPECIES: FixH family protein [unclassified Chryseobacterium]KQT22460.1 nitrogen fixation protein FixH [Chryseobacterium sp. Leaf404]
MKNLSWGHGVFIALLAFIIFILSMLFLFPNGQQNSEMVSDNYYEEELMYQQVIDAKGRADKLVNKPVYSQNSEGITIQFPADYNNGNARIKYVMNRTDDKNLDIKKDAVLDSKKSITIPANILKKGSYTLRLTWVKNNTEFRIDYDVLWK